MRKPNSRGIAEMMKETVPRTYEMMFYIVLLTYLYTHVRYWLAICVLGMTQTACNKQLIRMEASNRDV
jgi:hypothetical protein